MAARCAAGAAIGCTCAAERISVVVLFNHLSDAHAAARSTCSPRARDIAGRYRCAEIDAEIAIVDAGGALHGACAGPLGQGRMEQLEAIGPDLWALPCPRALDVSPPGDWTLAFRRDGGGRITGAKVGCWLARGYDFAREN
jgi:hypothetical protein